MTPLAPLSFSLEQRHVLHGIPSASGMAIIEDAIYVVGDNSPWLFKIDATGHIKDRIALWPDLPLPPEEIYPKKVKPDLESMAAFQDGGYWWLLMLGSGTRSPERDLWTEVRLGQVPMATTSSLTSFYANLRMHTGLTEDQLNIEAVEVMGDDLLLFNRGVNLVMRYSLAAVRRFIADGKDCPVPVTTRVTLPLVNGMEAGFSGAALLPGTEQLIFTATVEDTGNWFDDGAVLGSFIGMFPLHQLQDGLAPTCVMLDDTNLKVESVAVTHYEGKSTAHLLLVTDADGGHSELLSGWLSWADLC